MTMDPGTMRQAAPASNRPNLSGVLWAVVGVGIFAFIFVSGRLSGTGVSALQVIWFRYLGGFVTVVAGALLTQRLGSALATGQLPVHALRAAAGGFGGVAAVYAATHMPVASASAIGLLDGLFTLALAAFVLGERATRRQWLATLGCVAGALIVLGSQGAFADWRGEFARPAAVAAGGAALFALESILIKRLVHAERSATVLFYVNLFGSLILGWPALAAWQPLSAGWVIAFLGLGPLAILAQYCNLLAFRRTTAGIAGAARYAWIVHATFLGWLCFDQTVTVATWVGLGIVVGSGCRLALLRS